jgi:hypothetical protein
MGGESKGLGIRGERLGKTPHDYGRGGDILWMFSNVIVDSIQIKNPEAVSASGLLHVGISPEALGPNLPQ